MLPGGSTNVFARSIGLPNDPVAAAKELVPALKERHFRRVGLGMVNGRYFCFHTGVGYDAAVVREVEKRASVKRWVGHPLFIYAALRTWFSKYDRTQPHFAVELPDEGASVPDGYFTVVLNTSPYTYLGNRALDLSPYANLERGLVAITFRSLRAWPFLATLARTLRGRPIESNRTVDEHHDLARLDIESASTLPLPGRRRLPRARPAGCGSSTGPRSWTCCCRCATTVRRADMTTARSAVRAVSAAAP